uniref:Ion transport domain-containing protein n=1 Tax=Chlamydomonas leiostraca TaxID=1034604 RepID=A0A7S0S7T2_9CHLO
MILFLRSLYFSFAISWLGSFVCTVILVMKRLFPFFFLLATIFAGFGLSFVVLLGDALQTDQYDEDMVAPDGSIGAVFIRLFVSIFSGLDDDYMRQKLGPGNTTVLYVMLKVLYQVLVTIVLLNILIAIIGESYSQVLEQKECELLRNKATLLIEAEALMPAFVMARINAAISKKWLYAIKPRKFTEEQGAAVAHDDDSHSQLEKQLQALAASVAAISEQLRRQDPAWKAGRQDLLAQQPGGPATGSAKQEQGEFEVTPAEGGAQGLHLRGVARETTPMAGMLASQQAGLSVSAQPHSAQVHPQSPPAHLQRHASDNSVDEELAAI